MIDLSLRSRLRAETTEPIGNLPGAWVEMPETSYGVVSKGDEQPLPFAPKHPGRGRGVMSQTGRTR